MVKINVLTFLCRTIHSNKDNINLYTDYNFICILLVCCVLYKEIKIIQVLLSVSLKCIGQLYSFVRDFCS